MIQGCWLIRMSGPLRGSAGQGLRAVYRFSGCRVEELQPDYQATLQCLVDADGRAWFGKFRLRNRGFSSEPLLWPVRKDTEQTGSLGGGRSHELVCQSR